MDLLITGIHGFVGRNLVEAFRSENTIYGLDILDSEMEGVTRIFKYTELSEIPHVDVVIHLAGKSVETNDLSEALDYFETNAGLTRALFNWFKQSSSRTFIFFSSVKAAADVVQGEALTEEAKPKPFGTLGESKYLAEQYIMSQYVIDKKVYVLRPCIIHGNGSIGNKNMRMLYRWVKKGRPFLFGKFECSRSFTTMDNLTYVLKRMLALDIPSGIYNVADDETLTLVDVYEIMGTVLGKKLRVWKISKCLIKLYSLLGKRFKWYFDSYRYKKVSSNFVVSNLKIKKALGIRKMPVSTIDGLTKSIQSYRDKNKNQEHANHS